jgi:hypothetical protein
MGFNQDARLVRDGRLPPWRRFAALRECVRSFCWCTGLHFQETMERFGVPMATRTPPRPPPDDDFLLGAINALEKERNVFLERQRAFARSRIRAKMRGNRQLSKAEREIVRAMI